MTRAIDVMEAAIQAALDARDHNIAGRMRRADANRIARDHILKAWMRLQDGQVREQAFRNSMAVSRHG